MKRSTPALLLCTALAMPVHAGLFDGLSGLVSAKPDEATNIDPSVNPESQLENFIEVEGEEDGLLKGIKRVAITQFQIEFMTATSANAFAKSGYGSNTTNANTYVNAKLEGVGVADFQKLTDGYYDSLVSSLKTAGIEVVEQALVLGHPDFKEMTSGARSSPSEEDAEAGKGVLVSSRGLPIWFESEDGFIRKASISFGKKEKTDPYQSFGTQMGQISAAKGAAINEPALMKALDAGSLRVRITVPFMQIKTSTTSSSAKTFSKGTVQIEKWVSRLSFVAPDTKRVRVRLKKPIVATSDVGELKDVTTSGEKAIDAAANVVAIATMFMGGPVKGTMQSGVSYALQADPQRYADTVNSQLDTTQKLFTAALLKAKQ
ncbi:MAG: hypothetical protein KA740_11970 [Rhodoferax sp.]|jgi:hypothetical protein|nr:hypothetical protein [Rhodoferax sp.]